MMADRNQQIGDVKRRALALKAMHPVWRTIEVGQERFEMATCRGAEALLDELIAADPASPAVRDERLPYWTEIWPSALAVAGRVLEAGRSLAGQRVLDLGCGLGLAGVAAGRCGAEVCFCDYDPQAVRFAALNWVANVGGTPWAVVMDWREPAFEAVFDRILAADIVYEKRFFEPVIHAFDCLLKPGGEVWLGEPNRPFSSGFFEVLAAHGYAYSREERLVPFPNPAKSTSVGVYGIYKNVNES
jgi:predicted nicotinamide N-methyase